VPYFAGFSAGFSAGFAAVDFDDFLCFLDDFFVVASADLAGAAAGLVDAAGAAGVAAMGAAAGAGAAGAGAAPCAKAVAANNEAAMAIRVFFMAFLDVGRETTAA